MPNSTVKRNILRLGISTFLTNFTEEVDEFQRSLQHLRDQETSSQGLRLLQETDDCSRSD